MDTLSSTWYCEEPIDFEHKQYIILGYLQKVDSLYLKKIVSPHLLFLEKMAIDMELFKGNLNAFKFEVTKNDYVYLFDKKTDLRNPHLNEVIDIIDYSLPLIKLRVENGRFLVKKFKLIYF